MDKFEHALLDEDPATPDVIEAMQTAEASMASANPVKAWPEIQPLTAEVALVDYPLDALPARIRAAVDEVAAYVQAPLPLVASSALASISLATQAHIDVQRDTNLQGPTSLYFLTIAASGERKSTCDGYFMQAVRDYEAEQTEASRRILADYLADLDIWEARLAGIKDRIRKLAKERKNTSADAQELQLLKDDRPKAPRIPRLLYCDVTPESLAFDLATKYPSGGVIAAEGGTVLGSHAMGRESVSRNLGLLNVLWDGGALTIDRRTSDSYTVAGARLTVGLMIQEAALQGFLESAGDLARGSGFLARFLMAQPQSTQGMRPYVAPPESWPALTAFNDRMGKLLRMPAPIGEDGCLTPALMTFSPETKEAWIEFYNEIERDLGAGGELCDVRDIASKIADNAARLAALFQYFEDGALTVGLDAFKSAHGIAAWHLYEARRFYGELTVSEDLSDAVKLSAWLVQFCQRMKVDSVSTTKVLQMCTPPKLRRKESLHRALKQLAETGRVRLEFVGKTKTIYLNPELLREGGNV